MWHGDHAVAFELSLGPSLLPFSKPGPLVTWSSLEAHRRLFQAAFPPLFTLILMSGSLSSQCLFEKKCAKQPFPPALPTHETSRARLGGRKASSSHRDFCSCLR